MGKRGPKPLTDRELAARGSTVPKRRESAKAKLEQVGGAGRPTPPAWLGADELAIWNRITPTLLDMGIASIADADSLARYCHALVEWVSITKELRTQKRLIKPKGAAPYQNPLIKIRTELARELQHLEDRFGLTPAARMTLNVSAAFVPGYRSPALTSATPSTPQTPSTQDPKRPLGGEQYFSRTP